MAKIIQYSSGPRLPDPGEEAPLPIVERKEVVVTPNPKTKAQRQANAQARGLAAAEARQEQNAHAPAKLSKGQKKARRKRERQIRYTAVKADLAAGKITPDEAQNRLPRRQEKRKRASNI